MDTKTLIQAVDSAKARLDALRPLSPHTVKSLHEKLVLEWTYNSNAIEGNTLTLKETKVVLEGITVGGKTLREHSEAINHKEAIDYVEGMVAAGERLTEWQIKSIHHLILKTIDDANAGKYRQENGVIGGAVHVPPDFTQVPAQMEALIRDYHSGAHHPVETAARLHSEFVKIHPFVDGNGRTARLLMNLELMRTGYLPVVILNRDRLAYYEALDKAHTSGDLDDFIRLVAERELATLEEYLHIVAPS